MTNKIIDLLLCSPDKPPGHDQQEEGEDEEEDGVRVVTAGP